MALVSKGKHILERVSVLEEKADIINLSVESNMKALQQLSDKIDSMSDEISKLTESNEQICRLIEQKFTEGTNELDKINEATVSNFETVASSVKNTQTSIENIGKILVENNKDTINAMETVAEMTNKVLGDYRANLNEIITSIMASNLMQNITMLTEDKENL